MAFLNKVQPLVYPSNSNIYKNVLLINSSLEDVHTIASSVNEDTFPIIYSVNSAKTELIDLLKSKFTSIDRLGIVFSSNTDKIKLFLDVKPFFVNNESTASPYSENVEFLLSIIREFTLKNIDFLACDTLNNSSWVNYYNILTKETGVVLGASNDKTGNIKYGGDWVMESTCQDVELIYFTKNIEYYKYLFDNPSWASGLYGPAGLEIYGSHMYVASYYYAVISQISLADGSITNFGWAAGTGLTYPVGLVIDGSYMYASNIGLMSSFDTTITQIRLSDGVITAPTWATGLNGPAGLVVYGSHMYVANYGGTTISEISLANGSITNLNWATGLNHPFALVIYNSYMYATNYDGTISKISLADGSIVDPIWASGLINPNGLAVYGEYMYVTNGQNGEHIVQLSLANGSITNPTWSPALDTPVGLIVYNGYLYESNLLGGTIGQFELPPLPPTPPANICFIASTPILTDQGVFPISKINPNKHTIKNKPIIDVTKTITRDDYLICFEKNSLDIHYPMEKTIMSKHHKVVYKGKMIEAYKFVGHFQNVYKVKYNGEVLYNILMEDHSKILANNLLCETLHPDNIIAKLYTQNCKFSPEVRDQIIMLLDDCVKNKDYVRYNKIAKLC